MDKYPDELPQSSLQALTTEVCALEYDPADMVWACTARPEDDMTFFQATPTVVGASMAFYADQSGDGPVEMGQNRTVRYPLETQGNLFSIVVTSPDKASRKTYLMRVTRPESESDGP